MSIDIGAAIVLAMTFEHLDEAMSEAERLQIWDALLAAEETGAHISARVLVGARDLDDLKTAGWLRTRAEREATRTDDHGAGLRLLPPVGGSS